MIDRLVRDKSAACSDPNASKVCMNFFNKLPVVVHALWGGGANF